MKIQPIIQNNINNNNSINNNHRVNNSKNISHKAEIHNNRFYDEIWKASEGIRCNFVDTLMAVRRHLPNHIIEIIDLKKLKEPFLETVGWYWVKEVDQYECTIFNHETKQEATTNIYYGITKPALKQLLEFLFDLEKSPFFEGIKNKKKSNPFSIEPKVNFNPIRSNKFVKKTTSTKTELARKTRPTKPVKKTKPVEITETAKDTKPTKPVKTAKTVKPVKETKPVETAETAKEAKPTKPVKTAKTVKPVKETKPVETAETVEESKITNPKKPEKPSNTSNGAS